MEQINIDYILFVYQDKGTFKLGRYDISMSNDLEAKIYDVLNSECTLKELMSKIKQTLPLKDLWYQGYCYDSEYEDVSFNAMVESPKIIMQNYFNSLTRLKDEIREVYRNEKDIPYAEKRKLMYEEIQSETERLDNVYIEKLHKNIKELQPYFAYEETRKKIQAEYPDVIIFSEDFRGWHDTGFLKITDDLYVSVSTNFLYGQSSYFRTTFQYKGVKLLTYSNLVRYRYSNMVELLKSTESYITCRNSWSSAISSVIDKGNLSQKNAEKFVSDFIEKETKSLIEGLKHILKNTPSVIESYSSNQDDYIRYNTKETGEDERYCIYPEEEERIVVIDKISSALRFVENLQKIENLGFSTKSIIETVISMNLGILDDVLSLIEEIKLDLGHLRKQQEDLRIEQKALQEGLQEYIDEIAVETKGMDDNSKKEYMEEYILQYPEYSDFLERKVDIRQELERLCDILKRRNNLYDHLVYVKDQILTFQ